MGFVLNIFGKLILLVIIYLSIYLFIFICSLIDSLIDFCSRYSDDYHGLQVQSTMLTRTFYELIVSVKRRHNIHNVE